MGSAPPSSFTNLLKLLNKTVPPSPPQPNAHQLQLCGKQPHHIFHTSYSIILYNGTAVRASYCKKHVHLWYCKGVVTVTPHIYIESLTVYFMVHFNVHFEFDASKTFSKKVWSCWGSTYFIHLHAVKIRLYA